MLDFRKYHGLGNDFLVVEASSFSDEILANVEAICDRHLGVGADGILVVGDAPSMLVYNRDGSRPQMCGNGVRCVARYLVEQKGFGHELTIETDAGPRQCVCTEDADGFFVDVEMGPGQYQGTVSVSAHGHAMVLHKVSMGNPHAVYFGAMDIPTIDAIGAELNENHPEFPEGVNFEVVGVGDVLDCVVYERGVGRTQACGTGACAVAVAAWNENLKSVGPTVVRLPGGPLTIDKRNGMTWMRGPAVDVYRGQLGKSWFVEK